MIWPITLLARGLAASTPGMSLAPRAAVVGERAVHVAALLVDGQPLGPVHLGRAQQVAGLARLDHHLALVGKAVGRRQRALAVHQRQPAAAAIGVEARHVQRAVVQQLRIGLGAARRDPVAADELVDVLEARVLARIDAPRGRPCVTATQAPSCAARPSAVRLTGVLVGSIGSISTTQPKRLNSFGWLLGVEALVVLGPAVEAGLAQCPSASGARRARRRRRSRTAKFSSPDR